MTFILDKLTFLLYKLTFFAFLCHILVTTSSSDSYVYMLVPLNFFTSLLSNLYLTLVVDIAPRALKIKTLPNTWGFSLQLFSKLQVLHITMYQTCSASSDHGTLLFRPIVSCSRGLPFNTL